MPQFLKKRIRYLNLLVIIFILSLILFYFYKSLKSSLFLQNKDRVNLIFYGEFPVFYSLGISDDVNYVLNLFPDLQILVPGGYGYYRVGAIGKLISLEKKPELLKTAFSLGTLSFIDFYFYKNYSNIYFGNKESKVSYYPRFKDFFMQSSNASYFDRIYLFLRFFNNRRGKFKTIKFIPTEKKDDRLSFLDDNFFKNYQGYFYQKIYRDERKNVQIIYNNSYKTASYVSQIIEGEGVRVVDLQKSPSPQKKCMIIENNPRFSKTANALASFFKCNLKKNKTEISDIILILGDREKDWEVE